MFYTWFFGFCMFKILKKIQYAAFILIFSACATPFSSSDSFLSDFTPNWEPVDAGVDVLYGAISKPKLRFWALRIDTANPSVEIVISPKQAIDGAFVNNALPSVHVSSFVKQTGCLAGINTAPFSPVSANEGEKRTVFGLTVSDGTVVSRASSVYDALVFYKDGSMAIEEQSKFEDFDTVKNAAGGFYAIMKNGELTPRVLSQQARHPRSAAGIADKILYLLVIDGRQSASEGATEAETALILQKFGATQAINFDGGGSSTLALRDENGSVAVLNAPVHRVIKGKERAVATCLGVRIRTVEELDNSENEEEAENFEEESEETETSEESNNLENSENSENAETEETKSR